MTSLLIRPDVGTNDPMTSTTGTALTCANDRGRTPPGTGVRQSLGVVAAIAPGSAVSAEEAFRQRATLSTPAVSRDTSIAGGI